LFEHIQPKPGEKITVELNGVKAEMTSQGMSIIYDKPQQSEALQAALLASKICRDIRAELVLPAPNKDKVDRFTEELLEAVEEINRWATHPRIE
jgi:hypothetical protein